jgi:hypothetical protein
VDSEQEATTMKTIRFNTGRLYTKAGQRVTATLRDDGVVTFMDHDRGVSGEFKLCGDRFDEKIVMEAYDHNVAQQTRRSYEDGFYAGGVNSKVEGE